MTWLGRHWKPLYDQHVAKVDFVNAGFSCLNGIARLHSCFDWLVSRKLKLRSVKFAASFADIPKLKALFQQCNTSELQSLQAFVLDTPSSSDFWHMLDDPADRDTLPRPCESLRVETDDAPLDLALKRGCDLVSFHNLLAEECPHIVTLDVALPMIAGTPASAYLSPKLFALGHVRTLTLRLDVSYQPVDCESTMDGRVVSKAIEKLGKLHELHLASPRHEFGLISADGVAKPRVLSFESDGLSRLDGIGLATNCYIRCKCRSCLISNSPRTVTTGLCLL